MGVGAGIGVGVAKDLTGSVQCLKLCNAQPSVLRILFC